MHFIRIDPITKKILQKIEYDIIKKEAIDNGLKIKILSKSLETITGYLISPGELIKSEKIRKLNQRNSKVINKLLNIKANTSMSDITIKTTQMLKHFEKGGCLLQYKFHPRVPEFKIQMYIEHIKEQIGIQKYRFQYEKLILSVQLK